MGTDLRNDRLEVPSATAAGTVLPLSITVSFGSCVCLFFWWWFKAVPEKISLDFSKIKTLPNFNIRTTPPIPYRPWKAGKYHMTMGIRKMPEEDWLALDHLYEEEQKFRSDLIKNHRNGVWQALPGSYEAIEETLEYIVKFLTKRYPQYFQRPKRNPNYIHNKITNKTFKVVAPYDQHPLEVAAQLVMEDINLLMQGDGADREYYLRASFSMGPAGWDIEERIGWPLRRIHHPVPMWQEKLRKPMDKFFCNLPVSDPVQRNTFFMQVDDTMFQQKPFPDWLPSPPKVEDIRIRIERQTLRRLPRSQAILFMVRTYLLPVVDLANEKEVLYSFREAVNAFPPEMAKYKAKHLWEGVFEEWYEKVMGDYIPESERIIEKAP